MSLIDVLRRIASVRYIGWSNIVHSVRYGLQRDAVERGLPGDGAGPALAPGALQSSEATEDGARLTFEHASLEVTLRAEDLSVRETAAAPCGELPADDPRACLDELGRSLAGGSGLIVGHSEATVRRLEVRTSEVAGLLASGAARVELRGAVISGNGIGVNDVTDTPGALVLEDGWVFDNGTDVARREIPLPEPSEALLGR